MYDAGGYKKYVQSSGGQTEGKSFWDRRTVWTIILKRILKEWREECVNKFPTYLRGNESTTDTNLERII
jgi:hypothetical protein